MTCDHGSQGGTCDGTCERKPTKLWWDELYNLFFATCPLHHDEVEGFPELVIVG